MIKTYKRLIISVSFSLIFLHLLHIISFPSLKFLTVNDRQGIGVTETMSAIFYLISFILCIIGYKKQRKIYPIILSLVTLILLGEETSYLQNYFHYSVPFVEKLNGQGEFNIHNLYFIHGGGSLRRDSISLNLLLKSQNLFRYAFFSFFIIFPILFRKKKSFLLFKRIGYILPTKNLLISMYICFIFNMVCTLSFEYGLRIGDGITEIRELMYSVFITLYLYITYKDFRRT